MTIFLSFTNLIKNVKDTNDDEDIEYGAILNSNFVSHLFLHPNRVRNKECWKNCYRRWSRKDFKKDLLVTRATFNLILDVIAPFIFKVPTDLNPEPINVDRQLGLTLYRLGQVKLLIRFLEYWLRHFMINTLRCPKRMKSGNQK